LLGEQIGGVIIVKSAEKLPDAYGVVKLKFVPFKEAIQRVSAALRRRP